jgi:hypothetical protein
MAANAAIAKIVRERDEARTLNQHAAAAVERLTLERDEALTRHREAMAFTTKVLRERDAAIDAAHAAAQQLIEAQATIVKLTSPR